ncbi:hypothetical protein GOBAR_DD16788 [Gossypium barbadense]|nr:hypothetical protein GOBAR_DD16788 [Gossypium barbadense]
MVSGAPAHPSTKVSMVPEAPARPRAYATGTVRRSINGTDHRSTAGTDRRSTAGNLTGGGGAPTSGHTVGVGRALENPCSLNITSP